MIEAQTNYDVDPSLVARALGVTHLRMEGEGTYTLTVLDGECTEEDLENAIQLAIEQMQESSEDELNNAEV